MEASLITNVLLPLALALIMFGLGLSLTVEDFRRVVLYPRAVAIGLAIQMAVLSVVAFVVAKLFALPPELAVGLMLLAAAPGGPTANIFSHLARGDVALNITLTAVNSALSLVTLPLILGWSLEHFLGRGQYIAPPVQKVLEVAILIVVPVAVGMAVRARAQGFAARMERPIRIFSVIVLAVLIAGAIAKEWHILGGAFAAVGFACLAFNLVSMAAGYGVPRLCRLPTRQAIAISMEIGIHNGTLAIFIALNVLQNAAMSIPPAIYSLIMFVTAGLFVLLQSRRATGAGQPS
ncbi:MAG: bile acid:sodium symporter family protein [Alphaproteobacteria bacterium]|nr:bile acid:sodium symporter family protein [Alphaproteobacteria bacterium]